MLIVRPIDRRAGVATALVAAVEARSRSGKLFISTNRSNAAMRQVCEHLGFEPSGVVENLNRRPARQFGPTDAPGPKAMS